MVPICFGYKLPAVLGASQVVLSQVALQPQPRGERAAAADGFDWSGTALVRTCQAGCARGLAIPNTWQLTMAVV